MLNKSAVISIHYRGVHFSRSIETLFQLVCSLHLPTCSCDGFIKDMFVYFARCYNAEVPTQCFNEMEDFVKGVSFPGRHLY